MLDAAALLQLQHPANACVKAGAKLYLLLFTDLHKLQVNNHKETD